ncbi:MAG: FAD-dependent monooxygenase [Rhodospirillales bacterium]|nr:FAD-dependent monooxygenase [Alphaproteobacteria bacterium]MCB1839119.1 FAD-dependent monooxygenase [Alphaproteobacteria bacterium]MCB9976151.1 FAD-dependent monooxygenase [Rhodospirillales bacterium]
MKSAKKNRAAGKNPDLLIVGGGIAGLALAVILGQEGVCIHLVDPYPPLRLKDSAPSGRTVALMESSLNILRVGGIGDVIDRYGTPLQAMRIIDDSVPGQEILTRDFEAQEIGMKQFGMNLPNSILRAALFDRVSQLSCVTLHIPGSLCGYQQEHHSVCAQLADETLIHARLIVGADGRASTVRSLSGIKSRKHEYEQSAITCIINHSRSHNFIATEFHRSGGPLALVPMPGNQSSVVWVVPSRQADALMALSREAFEQSLQEKTDNLLGGITLDTPPEAWPLMSMTALKLSAPRTALIAEAAHVMSPITAQGLNLSLRDVAALAETVIDALRLGLDPGTPGILRDFEKRRRPDIASRVAGVDFMNRIVSNDRMPLRDLRRVGLKIISGITPLRLQAMRHGLAPSMDAGRLSRGLPL